MMGSRLTAIAYPMVVLYLGGSPVVAGLAVFAATAPSLLCYAPAGALVDRWDPRKTMLASEIGRGLAIGAIAWMVATRQATIRLVIMLAVAEEILEVFAMLAERRYTRALVSKKQIRSALVSIEARTHVIVLFGRAIGGALFAVEPFLPFLVDLLSFGASVSSLLAIGKRQKALLKRRKQKKGKSRHRQRVHLMREVNSGLRTVWRDPYIRDASLVAMGMTLVSQALIILFLAQAHSHHLSPMVIGGVLAASGLGGLGGAFASQRLRLPGGWAKAQPAIWAVMLAVLALSGPWRVPCTAIAMMVLGWSGAMANVELDTHIMRSVRPTKLARVTSIDMLLTFLACSFGPVLGGRLSGFAGGQGDESGPAVWVLCGLSVCCALYAFRSRRALMPNGRAVRIGPVLHVLWAWLPRSSRQVWSATAGWGRWVARRPAAAWARWATAARWAAGRLQGLKGLTSGCLRALQAMGQAVDGALAASPGPGPSETDVPGSAVAVAASAQPAAQVASGRSSQLVGPASVRVRAAGKSQVERASALCPARDLALR
jgi:MFS family permease